MKHLDKESRIAMAFKHLFSFGGPIPANRGVYISAHGAANVDANQLVQKPSVQDQMRLLDQLVRDGTLRIVSAGTGDGQHDIG